MAATTEEFLEELGRRGYEPLLTRGKGTLDLELTDGRKVSRWLVKVDRGNVTVSRGRGSADSVIRSSKELFDKLASGRANPVVALLRGDLTFEGDYNLAILFQRLFPGPPKRRRSASR